MTLALEFYGKLNWLYFYYAFSCNPFTVQHRNGNLIDVGSAHKRDTTERVKNEFSRGKVGEDGVVGRSAESLSDKEVYRLDEEEESRSDEVPVPVLVGLADLVDPGEVEEVAAA